jgi:predicted kinase
MNDRDSVRKVTERAGVIDVQMGLDDVGDVVRSDPELAELGLAVLCFAHVNFEHVRQPAPVLVRVARHRERVAAVDDDEAPGMAKQKERDRNLDAAERECAAVEEVEL